MLITISIKELFFQISSKNKTVKPAVQTPLLNSSFLILSFPFSCLTSNYLFNQIEVFPIVRHLLMQIRAQQHPELCKPALQEYQPLVSFR